MGAEPAARRVERWLRRTRFTACVSLGVLFLALAFMPGGAAWLSGVVLFAAGLWYWAPIALGTVRGFSEGLHEDPRG
jgi:hypothetical protein